MQPHLPPTNGKTVLNGAKASKAQFFTSLYAWTTLACYIQNFDQSIYQQWIFQLIRSTKDEIASLENENHPLLTNYCKCRNIKMINTFLGNSLNTLMEAE
jgi:hypothetical protein